jgi:AmiR/NasT family two-component response regulator
MLGAALPNAFVTSLLLLRSPDGQAPDLAADATAAGFAVQAQGDCAHLVRDALRSGADVVVCWLPRADSAFVQAVATLQAQQSTPLLVFTQDSGVEPMRAALEAGVHGWVVQGYAPQRLRPLVHLAQAREAQQRQWRDALALAEARLEERKLVDQAKAILMRARDLTESEAFQLLRTASMQGNQRVGQVSRQVIDAARVAGAINRAGQQRMLSQRLVKLYALACSRTDGAAAALLMRESVARIEENLAALEAELSAATYGDLIGTARSGWQALRPLVDAPAQPTHLDLVDTLAEAVLAHADALVLALEGSGLAATVGVINVSGRQRMLSQRMAKLALLAAVAPGEGQAQALLQAAQGFEDGLQLLAAAPLSTPQIRAALEQGAQAWARLQEAVPQAGKPAGRIKLAAASEELLELFDRLTQAYQHSIQVLMGRSG